MLRGKRDQRTPSAPPQGGGSFPRVHTNVRCTIPSIKIIHSCPSLEAVGSHRSSIERGVFGVARTAHVSC